MSRVLRQVAEPVIAAIVFGIIYCQAPLYYSNQNQYFLHGLAQSGFGELSSDWLAQTNDPTPVFSGLVMATQEHLHPWMFHIYYFVLFGIYFACLMGVFNKLADSATTPRLRLVFAAVVLTVHSAVIRWLSYRWFGLDYPWYFQAGVAGQYVLGAMFQPSTFGVLLILAIYLFVIDKPYLAVFFACLGATVHSTYILPAGLLTAAFMIALAHEYKLRNAIGVGAVALLLVLPVSIYVWVTFQPTSPAEFAEAQRILVQVRIPHHSIPRLWCDPIAVGQLLWIVLAVWLVRGSPLALVLGVSLTTALALTLLQCLIENNTLALLFPWRITAVLMPIATTVVVTHLVILARPWLEQRLAASIGVGVIGLLTVAGGLITWFHLGFQSGTEDLPLIQYVYDSKKPGDLYLLPVRIPKLAQTTRGSLSGDFKPTGAKRRDPRLIPIDLQRFRLAAGAPIYVDFKTIPYKDVDVLEWYDRLRRAERWYQEMDNERVTATVLELRKRGVTHVVVPASQPIASSQLTCVFGDEYYRVYALGESESDNQAPKN